MKSSKYRLKKVTLSIFIIILLLVATIFPACFANESRSAEIIKYDIHVTVLDNGTAQFEEIMTYQFRGAFNGVTRFVDFANAGKIENQSVTVLKDNQENELTLNTGNSYDATGANGSYNLEVVGTVAKFKIFNESKDDKKTFILRYTMPNAVACYKDVAEFNRKLIGTEWEIPIKNLTIRINVPEGSNLDELKLFGHGPLVGETRIEGLHTFFLSVPEVMPGTFVEARAVFPTRLLLNPTHQVDENALARIIREEKSIAENKTIVSERTAVKEVIHNHLYAKVAVIILSLAWSVLILYLYFKYDKELLRQFNGEYYYELPGEYTPAEMSYLIHFGDVFSRDITATLMDLVHKKHLTLGTEDDVYYFSRTSNQITTWLTSHEVFIMEWLIGKVGDGTKVSMTQIRTYCEESSRAMVFQADFSKWRDLVKESARKYTFIEDQSQKASRIGTQLGFAFFIPGFFILLFLKTTMGLFVVAEALILVLYSLHVKKRSPYGNEQYAKWMAFKNYLLHYCKIEHVTIHSTDTWERYLPYAISLNIATEVLRQFPIVFNPDYLEKNKDTHFYGFGLGQIALMSNQFESTYNGIDSSIQSAVTISSTNQSNFGGNGGFSGGSSFGGGAAGGGGAF